eukprot:15340928-Ditylum_brightwellii.AAC.1
MSFVRVQCGPLLVAEDELHNLDISVRDVDNGGFAEADILTLLGDVMIERSGKQDGLISGIGSIRLWNAALMNVTYAPELNWNTHSLPMDSTFFVVYNVDDTCTDNSNYYKISVEVLPSNDRPEWIVPGQNMVLQDIGGMKMDSVDAMHVDKDEDLTTTASVFDVDVSNGCAFFNIIIKATSWFVKLRTTE